MEPQHPGEVEPCRRSAVSRVTPEKVFVRGYEPAPGRRLGRGAHGGRQAHHGGRGHAPVHLHPRPPRGAGQGHGRLRADEAASMAERRQRVPGLGHPVFKEAPACGDPSRVRRPARQVRHPRQRRGRHGIVACRPRPGAPGSSPTTTWPMRSRETRTRTSPPTLKKTGAGWPAAQ
jgi:hypothetical protein